MLSHFTTSPLGTSSAGSRRMLAAPRGFEPRFTDPKSAVLPLDEGAAVRLGRIGAEDGTRTRDPHLGKVMLYQLSHFRSEIRPPRGWCREPDSNWRHRDFQSRALPTELSRPDGQPAVGCPSAQGTIPRASNCEQRRRRRRAGSSAARRVRVWWTRDLNRDAQPGLGFDRIRMKSWLATLIYPGSASVTRAGSARP